MIYFCHYVCEDLNEKKSKRKDSPHLISNKRTYVMISTDKKSLLQSLEKNGTCIINLIFNKLLN